MHLTSRPQRRPHSVARLRLVPMRPNVDNGVFDQDPP